MILFYAQTGPNEVRVTAPYLTFPALHAHGPKMYGVQPVSYTLPNEKGRTDFQAEDVKEIIYLPQNNQHMVIVVRFSDTFKGISGSTLRLRTAFTNGYNITFNIPYTPTTSLVPSTIPFYPLTISIPGNRNEATLSNVYVNSQLQTKSPAVTSGITIDTEEYKEANTGVLEVVGVTYDTNKVSLQSTLDAFKGNRSKFLESPAFADVDNLNASSSYFYIYAEECDKTPASTVTKGCFDSAADSAISPSDLRLNDGTCTYSRRSPSNSKIVHVPGGKTTFAKVTYFEEYLPQGTDPIDETSDFDTKMVQTYADGSAVPDLSPTTSAINITPDNVSVTFEWTDINSDTGFKAPMHTPVDDSVLQIDSNVGASNDNRSYTLAVFRTQSSGCLDSTALNYDANAVFDDGSCVFCDNILPGISQNFVFSAEAQSIATASGDDDNTLLEIETALTANINAVVSDYLATLAATVWTCKIYNSADVQLAGYGEQAVTGSEIMSLTNTQSASNPKFIKIPTTGSGLNSGSNYIAEIILTLSGCTYYFYIPFGVPFDGCSDPTAENYDPNKLNTGNGNCDYDIAKRSNCDGSVQAEIAEGTITSSGSYQFYVHVNGTFDEDGNLLNPTTTYTVVRQIYSVDGNFILSAASSDLIFEGETVSTVLNLNAIHSYVIVLTDTATGCTIELPVEHPLNIEEISVPGCVDVTAVNYNPDATEMDGSCIYCSDLQITHSITTLPTGTCSSSNRDGVVDFTVLGAPGNFTISLESALASGNTTLDLNATTASNLAGLYRATVTAVMGPGLTCTAQTDWFALSTDTSGCGCMDVNAVNYDPTATEDDGSCLTFGCTNSSALNYNANASVDDGSCVFSADSDAPLCIPNKLDNNQDYEAFLNSIKKCVSDEGQTLLLKIKSGIKCDSREQVKLSLITYLLNRIGLECLYNCNYIFPHSDKAVDCSALWTSGGPSGPSLVYSTTTAYVQGDIVKLTLNDVDYYYTANTAIAAGMAPPNSNTDWVLCNDVTLPVGTETYLQTFINFARKFCTVCITAPQPISNQMQDIANTLDGIQLEDGDNIEL